MGAARRGGVCGEGAEVDCGLVKRALMRSLRIWAFFALCCMCFEIDDVCGQSGVRIDEEIK